MGSTIQPRNPRRRPHIPSISLPRRFLLSLLVLSALLAIGNHSTHALSPLSSSDIPSTKVFEISSTYYVYDCSPTGDCEECTAEEMKSATVPYCTDTGSKQRLECQKSYEVPVNTTEALPWNPKDVVKLAPDQEVPYMDWVECDAAAGAGAGSLAVFEMVNIVFLVASGYVILWRRRLLSVEQYRRIASRLAS